VTWGGGVGFGDQSFEKLLMSLKGSVKGNHIRIIRGRSVPLLRLFLDAPDVDSFGAKGKAGKSSLLTEIILLFKVGDCLGKIVTGQGFKLSKKVREKFTSRAMAEQLNEVFNFGDVLIHVVKVANVQLTYVSFDTGFEDIGVWEDNAC